MKLPRLLPEKSGDPARTDSVLFAVYAPFGSDEALSTYPDGSSRDLAQHPLYQGLLKVAAQGIHVAALIDGAHDDTYLVEIEAGRPAEVKVSSRWKQDMAAPANLAGFLRHAHQSRPSAAIVLALEGHGAGYLPEIARRQLSAATLTRDGAFEWRISADAGAPILPAGSPLLPAGSPLLPADFDRRFLNVAAPELTFDRLLQGGEPVHILGALVDIAPPVGKNRTGYACKTPHRPPSFRTTVTGRSGTVTARPGRR